MKIWSYHVPLFKIFQWFPSALGKNLISPKWRFLHHLAPAHTWLNISHLTQLNPASQTPFGSQTLCDFFHGWASFNLQPGSAKAKETMRSHLFPKCKRLLLLREDIMVLNKLNFQMKPAILSLDDAFSLKTVTWRGLTSWHQQSFITLDNYWAESLLRKQWDSEDLHCSMQHPLVARGHWALEVWLVSFQMYWK